MNSPKKPVFPTFVFVLLIFLTLASCVTKPVVVPVVTPPSDGKHPLIQPFTWTIGKDGAISRSDSMPVLRIFIEKLPATFNFFLKSSALSTGDGDTVEYAIFNQESGQTVVNGRLVTDNAVLVFSTAPIIYKGTNYPGCIVLSRESELSLSAVLGCDEFLASVKASSDVDSLKPEARNALTVLQRSNMVNVIKHRKKPGDNDGNFDAISKALKAGTDASSQTPNPGITQTRGWILVDKTGASTVPDNALVPAKNFAALATPSPALLAELKKAGDTKADWKTILKNLYPNLTPKAIYK